MGGRSPAVIRGPACSKNIERTLSNNLKKYYSNLEKNKLIDHLEKRKIETRMFFPAIHTLLPYKESNSKFKESTQISERGLYLPSSVTLTEKHLDFISNEIIKFFI